jgi:hypothetical protein
MPWWSYPITAAAIVIVSFIVWSTRQPIPPTAPLDNFQNTYMLNDAEALAERLADEFEFAEPLAETSTQVAVDDLDTFFITPAEVATW